MADPVRLDDIALRVLDGGAVDWQSELAAPGEQNAERVLRNLRLVESIARTLREQPSEPGNERLVQDLLDSLQGLSAPEPAMDAPGQWGKLQIRERIGSGAFADVYRAYEPALKRDVALKLFRSTDRAWQQRLLEEGQRMARVNHPAVVRIYGAEEHDQMVGLWMELVEGQTLDQPLSEGRKRSAAEVVAAGRSLCGALAAVHQAGVIHGDIKAQNVLRDSHGHLMLTDFGSGAVSENPDEPAGVRGTPLYLAPEILAGRPASPQSDIYSLGVLLFYLASADFPVKAPTLQALQSEHSAGHRNTLHDLRPDFPEALVAAIDRATQADPVQRFQTMGEFAQALSEAGYATQPPATPKARWMWGIGTVVALLAAAWLWYGPSTESMPQHLSGYRLETALHRVTAAGKEKIGMGARVDPGDALSLEVSASADLHVYVFNEDQRGNAFALFPLAAINALNPLAGGRSHNLPGTSGDNQFHWLVDSPGGLERIHIVASPDALKDLELLYADLPPASLAGRLADGFRPRGIGSVGQSPGVNLVSAAPLALVAQEAANTGQDIQGAYYEVIELNNPGD